MQSSTEVVRHEFGGIEKRTEAETSMAAVQAREQALVQSRFIMAERHPRNWMDIRVRLLEHCDRGGFAVAAWYKKPAGRKQINGEWVETYAEGLSARFAEVARQEVGNLMTTTTVTYEDERTRIVSACILDLQRNNSDARDITISKVVEKRGKKNKTTQEWEPPEGRDVISSRLNSKGEPVYLCVATDDEVKMRQNAEISKAQRDETLRLIPRDILDDAIARIAKTKADPKKVDPTTMRNKIIDAFATLNVIPSDLVNYLGCDINKASPAQLDELRGLHAAIKDNETTFDEAMRLKYGTQEDGDQGGSAEEQEAAAKRRVEELQRGQQQTATTTTTQPPAEDGEARTPTVEQPTTTTPSPSRSKFGSFGGGKK